MQPTAGVRVDGKDDGGMTALIAAAKAGHTAVVQQLLAAGASPMLPNQEGILPLHEAARHRRLAATRLLLQAAPQAAHVYCEVGFLPVHLTAGQPAATGVLQAQLDAAPDTLLQQTRSDPGQSILHIAASLANTSAVQLLVQRCPDMARLPSKLGPTLAMLTYGFTPLHLALINSRSPRHPYNPALTSDSFIDAARPMVACLPPTHTLPLLPIGGHAALSLYADAAANWPLSPTEWDQVPSPCPCLAHALPAVIQRSEAEAACLVARLPAADRQRLQAFALALNRAQQQAGIDLPAGSVRHILSLFDA